MLYLSWGFVAHSNDGLHTFNILPVLTGDIPLTSLSITVR